LEILKLGSEDEILILHKSEHESWYNDCLLRVIDDPRWYLNNLDFISSFKVSWLRYGKKNFKGSKPKGIQ